MAENEKWLYEDKSFTIKGQKFDVTLVFPVPEDVSETAYEKLKQLINREKIS